MQLHIRDSVSELLEGHSILKNLDVQKFTVQGDVDDEGSDATELTIVLWASNGESYPMKAKYMHATEEVVLSNTTFFVDTNNEVVPAPFAHVNSASVAALKKALAENGGQTEGAREARFDQAFEIFSLRNDPIQVMSPTMMAHCIDARAHTNKSTAKFVFPAPSEEAAAEILSRFQQWVAPNPRKNNKVSVSPWQSIFGPKKTDGGVKVTVNVSSQRWDQSTPTLLQQLVYAGWFAYAPERCIEEVSTCGIHTSSNKSVAGDEFNYQMHWGPFA